MLSSRMVHSHRRATRMDLMKQDVIEQLRRLEEIGQKHQETVAKLMEAGKEYARLFGLPEPKNREDCLKLADYERKRQENIRSGQTTTEQSSASIEGINELNCYACPNCGLNLIQNSQNGKTILYCARCNPTLGDLNVRK